MCNDGRTQGYSAGHLPAAHCIVMITEQAAHQTCSMGHAQTGCSGPLHQPLELGMP